MSRLQPPPPPPGLPAMSGIQPLCSPPAWGGCHGNGHAGSGASLHCEFPSQQARAGQGCSSVQEGGWSLALGLFPLPGLCLRVPTGKSLSYVAANVVWFVAASLCECHNLHTNSNFNSARLCRSLFCQVPRSNIGLLAHKSHSDLEEILAT